jgi:hypothetical protein
MSIACAVGIRRVLRGGPGGTWGPRLVGAYGSSGKRLFQPGAPAIPLRLAHSTTTAGGLVILTYQPR